MTMSDGRSTRWDQHRIERRDSLVRATLRAIRRHGAQASMDHIAAEARTSKPVIYRHFGDRSGLYRAVVDQVQDYIGTQLESSGIQGRDALDTIAKITETYLQLIAHDPQIYRFVVTRPLVDGPVEDPVRTVGARLSDTLTATLAPHLPPGCPPAMAATWAHGIVGCVWAVSEAWVADGMSRPIGDVASDVCALFQPRFDAGRLP